VLFSDAYDLFNAAYVPPFVRAQWQLTPHALGLILATGFAGAALAMLLLATTIGGNLAFIAVACSGVFIFGTQAVMNNYTAMSYETYLRGTAVGIAGAVSRVGGMLGPILIGWTQEMRNAMWATLLMLALPQLASSR